MISYLFKSFFIFLISLSLSGSAFQIENELNREQVDEILQKAPKNVLEILDYVDNACVKAERMAQEIQDLPLEESTFNNTIRKWNKIGETYFESIAFLHGIEAVTTDPLVIETGKKGCEKLKGSLGALLKNEALLDKLVSFIETHIDSPKLTPSEKYYFRAFLLESKDVESESLKARIDQLKGFVDEGMIAFTPYLGDAQPKQSVENTFSVLNWNVCFLPGVLSLTYGGMLPWEYRLDKVVEFIKNSSADVVCLQEVFQEEAAKKLYESLKGEYAFFYVNISPQNFGFNPSNISLGSGLFVASKYEIPEGFWEKYKESWLENITRGFFDFTIKSGEKQAQIITTHLDASLTMGSAENFRALQLKQILSHLDEKMTDLQKSLSPVIICGDLNVYWGDSEPAEGIMKKFFYDPYNSGASLQHTCCDFTGYWWPEYVLNTGRKKFDPKPCILDYALLLKSIPSGENFSCNHVAETQVLQANYPENPEGALSDHHALLTTFFWQSKK